MSIKLWGQDRPNFLLLTFEDTSPQFIGCYGNEGAKTFAIDSLARQEGGVLFKRAYSNSTVSSASRSCLITGMDVNILGTGNHRYERVVPDSIKGYPYYLKQAGYYTTNNVKTDYNISNSSFIDEVWSESSVKAHWRNRSNDTQPFLSVFNIMYSHQSYVSRNIYSSYLNDVFKYLDKERVSTSEEITVPPFYKEGEEFRMLMTRVQNCINYTDQIIAQRLKELREDNLDDNTIIFCFADHGEGIPRGKTCSIGMGYRVPFVVWFPPKWRHLNPFKTSVITEKQICFEDVAPTILELARVKIPSYMKGVPIFRSEEEQKYIHGSRNRIDDSLGIDRTVIKGKYVYTKMFYPYLPMVREQGYAYDSDLLVAIRRELLRGSLTEVQLVPFQPFIQEYLYDIEADMWELNNLAHNPMYKDLLQELRTEMIRYAKDIKDLGFIPEFEIHRRIQTKEPMSLRDDYNIDAIVDAAMLVGQENVLSEQMELLQSNDPLVRYWAAVGIYVQGEKAISQKEQIIKVLEEESFEGSKLKLAAFLYKYCDYMKARYILEQYLKGRDNLLANEVAIMIQDMGDKILDFKDLIDEVQPYWQIEDKNYCVSPAVNVTQLIMGDKLHSPFSEEIVCGKNICIVNYLTGGKLGVKNGNQISQTFQEGSGAIWKLEKKDGGYFAIIHAQSGMALTVNGENSNGVCPILSLFTNEDSQLWNLRQYRNGFFIENKLGKKPLQVNGQSKEENATISQWEWNGNLHFVWKLNFVDELSSISISKGGLVEEELELLHLTRRGNILDLLINTNIDSPISIRIYSLMGNCLGNHIVYPIGIGTDSYSVLLEPYSEKFILLELRQKKNKDCYTFISKFINM